MRPSRDQWPGPASTSYRDREPSRAAAPSTSSASAKAVRISAPASASKASVAARQPSSAAMPRQPSSVAMPRHPSSSAIIAEGVPKPISMTTAILLAAGIAAIAIGTAGTISYLGRGPSQAAVAAQVAAPAKAAAAPAPAKPPALAIVAPAKADAHEASKAALDPKVTLASTSASSASDKGPAYDLPAVGAQAPRKMTDEAKATPASTKTAEHAAAKTAEHTTARSGKAVAKNDRAHGAAKVAKGKKVHFAKISKPVRSGKAPHHGVKAKKASKTGARRASHSSRAA